MSKAIRLSPGVVNEESKDSVIIYSPIVQSVERMTVNHDVAGSSPAGGATGFLPSQNPNG